METGFWSNVARGLFATIDRALYGLDSILYEILNTIVNEVHLFSNEAIDTFAVRVYTFLGLIMVFKVTFSLINYLVNPDSISDKTNGAGNVAKNIVITLFLIVLTPYAFDFLYRAQSAIINDQLVAKVILGDVNTDKAGMKVRMSPGCGNDVAQTSDMGEFIALMTLRPFYQMEEGSIEDGVKTQYCLGGQDGEKIKNLLSSDIYKASKNKIYSIDYSFLLSTVAGVVVLLMLLTACMEIALRAIKLGFLEIIAPIPILSYIDPKSGKDGIFKKWLKEVGKTWASLFVRLAAIYFAIYVISLIDEATENISNQNLGMWVSLFIVIGALMFAKQFPKLIEDIFGIKLDGLSLHPIKTISEQAAGGKTLIGAGVGAAAGGLAFAGGMGANAWAAHIRNNEARKKINGYDNLSFGEKMKQLKAAGGLTALGVAGSMIGGGTSAGLRTFGASVKAGDKITPLKNIEKGITDSSTARTRRAAGYGIGSAIMDKMTDMAHIPQSYGTTSELKNRKKMAEQRMNELIARNESLRDQAAYLKAQNPNVSLAYDEAGKIDWIKDADGKQKRTYSYANYDQYNQAMLDRMNNATDEELERLNAIGILSKEEFEKARAYDDAIIANDEEIIKVKKEISKIEENMKKDK